MSCSNYLILPCFVVKLREPKSILMKKIIIIAVIGFSASLTSCKKGTCTCQVLGSEITTTHEAETREDYKDLKEGCENAGCDWSAKM